MEKTEAGYKQAILIGAAPMGKEAEQLLSLLEWAGYEKEKKKEPIDNSKETAEETEENKFEGSQNISKNAQKTKNNVVSGDIFDFLFW